MRRKKGRGERTVSLNGSHIWSVMLVIHPCQEPSRQYSTVSKEKREKKKKKKRNGMKKKEKKRSEGKKEI